MYSHTTPGHATSVPSELGYPSGSRGREKGWRLIRWGAEFPKTSVLYRVMQGMCKTLHLTSGNSIKEDPNDAHGKSAQRVQATKSMADVYESDLWPICSLEKSSSKALQNICWFRRAGCRGTMGRVVRSGKAKKHGSRPESLPSPGHSEEYQCFVYRGKMFINYLFESYFIQAIISIVFHFGVPLQSG